MDFDAFKRRLKKFLWRTLITLVIISVAAFIFFSWSSFSSGLRSGVVVKISKKGFLFKTYEGQLNLDTFGAIKSANVISESFEFSVEGNDRKVIKALEEASLTGERVSLHYVERFVTFPWKGDTKYFVDGVVRQPAKPSP